MSLVASRYAVALAEAADRARMDPADVTRQLDDFAFAWNESHDLRVAFTDPVIPANQKVAVLDALNQRIGLSQLVRNFIAVLIGHDRIGLYNEVVEEYRIEADRRRGIFEAEIVSARALGDSERRDLESQVAKVAGGQVNVTYSQDSALLGGVVVRLGSTVYDGSVRGRLDRLKEELVAG